MRYPVPCYYCGNDVLVDQPDTSIHPIKHAECERCRRLAKRNFPAVLQLVVEKMRRLRGSGISLYEMGAVVPWKVADNFARVEQHIT